MAENVVDIWDLLTSPQKLDRDRGVCQLQEQVKRSSVEVQELSSKIQATFHCVTPDQLTWETKLGVLLASITLCPLEPFDPPLPTVLQWLTDDEVRVRTSAGDLLGSLCQHKGTHVYDECCEKVLQLIRTNLERSSNVVPEEEQADNAKDAILHETAGWRNLETSVHCLQKMVDGCGQRFREHVDQKLLDTIFVTLSHENRFVRETGYHALSSIIATCGSNSPGKSPSSNPVDVYSSQLSTHLASGLADNWSQVRMAATVASRQFLLAATSKHEDLLLPRLCLNRYYLAEGVRIYTQQTWLLVGGGKDKVEANIDHVVQYYVQCTTADNHAVREAACQCIAELAVKIDPSFLQPHVDLLLASLLKSFQDDSWPVRDMACVACGTFVKCYPGSVSVKDRIKIMDHFWTNLQDPISSVRQGAALALANAVRAYKEEISQDVFARIQQGLEGLADQPEESPGKSNAAKMVEDQPMYSCGSLAPKMMGCSGGGGQFRRPSEPWEMTDGCLYLISELAGIPEYTAKVAGEMMPLMETVSRDRHYNMHCSLLETVAKILPGMAKKMGKKLFKPHLERFFDALFYACDSDNALAAAAAKQCLGSLSEFLGPNIMRGRVEQYNARYAQLLDDTIQEPHPHYGMMGTSAPINIPMPHQSKPSLGGTPTGSPK